MIRVLQVFGEPLSSGGQESFVMNMYESIDRSEVQFDFFTPFYCDNNSMKSRIEKLGGQVFFCGKRFETKLRKKHFKSELKKFLSNNHYDVVHIHSGSTFSLAEGSKIAKKMGVKKVIIHSHATGFRTVKHFIIKLLSTKKFIKFVDVYCACSYEAAKFKFPNEIMREEKYIIIKNGIDLNEFHFSKKNRDIYRKELNIEKNFVVCHVGRFSKEKNHLFLLEVFKELKKKIPNAKLILVGQGSEKEKVYNKVCNYKLNDDVMFLGVRNDISEIMQASDVFVFPSFYEGLGIVTIEAQAVGLPVYSSENIPKEAAITSTFNQLYLSSGAIYWANRICSDYKKIDRKKHLYGVKQEIIKSGYSVDMSAKKLMDLYLNIK